MTRVALVLLSASILSLASGEASLAKGRSRPYQPPAVDTPKGRCQAEARVIVSNTRSNRAAIRREAFRTCMRRRAA